MGEKLKREGRGRIWGRELCDKDKKNEGETLSKINLSKVICYKVEYKCLTKDK